jgi:hypothetical protein
MLVSYWNDQNIYDLQLQSLSLEQICSLRALVLVFQLKLNASSNWTSTKQFTLSPLSFIMTHINFVPTNKMNSEYLQLLWSVHAFHVRQAQDSILGPDVGYSDSLWFPRAITRKCWDGTLKWVTTATFHGLFIITNNTPIICYIRYAAQKVS